MGTEKLTISMLGEKDHGKSTLIGRLLMATGSTTKERIADAREASKGKRFEPGYLLDSFSEERQNEMTIDTTRAEIIWNKRMYELVDVPGHLELIKNMISGASNANTAILLVSAKKEERFTKQSKRHLFLATMLGIDSLVVAVNKMDTVSYDREVFNQINREVRDYLDNIGFNGRVTFAPISAYSNENLVKDTARMKWYNGEPLMKILEKYSSAKKRGSNKLRALVQDVYDTGETKAAFCMLYSGKINVGEEIHMEPSNRSARVSKIHIKGRMANSALSGTNAAVEFKGNVLPSKGEVLYGVSMQNKPTNRFTSKVFAISRITYTKKLTLKMNNNHVLLKGLHVKRIISPLTGQHSHPKSNSLISNSAAIVEFSLNTKWPVERFEECEELGRFMLYTGSKLVGIGRIEEV